MMPLAADGYVVIGGLEGDRPGIADHLIAVAGDELAGRIDRERAVARIALLSVRRLHDEVAAAADGDVERVAGVLDRALAHVDPARAVFDESDAPILAGESLIAGPRHEVFLEHRVVGLVARGVDVRDVVGDDVEFMRERHLPRQADEKGVLHRYSPPDPRSCRSAGRFGCALRPLSQAADSADYAEVDCRSRANAENEGKTIS